MSESVYVWTVFRNDVKVRKVVLSPITDDDLSLLTWLTSLGLDYSNNEYTLKFAQVDVETGSESEEKWYNIYINDLTFSIASMEKV